MLHGTDPLLTGELLARLWDAGHGDAVAIVDAHFPARRVNSSVVDLPGVDAPQALRAVLSALPQDDDVPAALMANGTDERYPVQSELEALIASTGSLSPTFVERSDFYSAAEEAVVVIRTGETRPFGCVLVHKGLVHSGGTLV